MILTGFLFLPLAFIPAMFFLKKDIQVKMISFFFSLLHFATGITLLYKFNRLEIDVHQFKESFMLFKPLGLHYALGVDGLSLLLSLLTVFLLPLIILGTWSSVKENFKLYYINLFLLQICILGTFLSMDMALFFMFFEASLIPMLLLMGVCGGANRIYAARKIFLFTFVGSVFLFGAIATMSVLYESIHGSSSLLISELQRIQLPFVKGTIFSTQTVLFFCFLMAFAIKAPLFPFHTWLPDAHVEAPTGGSVILASLMLKMGAYGMIRFLPLYFPQASHHYSWFVCLLALIGIIYGAMVAFVQTDIKKLIAYSSVSHMGYVVLGIFAWNSLGAVGSSFQIISHALTTGGLFLMIGMLHERFKTREIVSFGGLAQIMPNFTICFLLLTLGSISVPLTSGFVGEFLIIMGAFQQNIYYGIVAALGVFMGAAYMLNLVRKVFYGPLNPNIDLKQAYDLNGREWCTLIPLIALVFILGVCPSLVTIFLDSSISLNGFTSFEGAQYVNN